MTPKQIVEAIKTMRDRQTLAAIIHAAENRDSHLAALESDERRKRAWSKYSHLRKGDTVFVHVKPVGKYEWLWAKPLTVIKVAPRKKEIVVQGDKRGVGATLTALMCLGYKLSEEPTAASFDNALTGGVGDDTAQQRRDR